MDNSDSTADFIATKIREHTQRLQGENLDTQTKKAIAILERCFSYRRNAPDQSNTFALVPKLAARSGKGVSVPWVSGDLESGETGPEFVYAYLPTKIIEKLLSDAEKDPSSIGADTPTAGATVYLLNNLPQVIDEAIADLQFEAEIVLKELSKGLDNGSFDLAFDRVVNEIIRDGNKRRRARLKTALWELNSRKQLTPLSKTYRRLQPAWKAAVDIYKNNEKRVSWKRTDWKLAIQNEVATEHGVNLPVDLLSLLSNDSRDYMPDQFNPTASGFALEHAARLCEIAEFGKGTEALKTMVSTQERSKKQTKTPQDSKDSKHKKA